MLEQNYLYKNTNTLRNKYNIKDPKKLYERCAHDAARAAVNFRHEPLPLKFDAAYLKQIHWSLFYKSFEWAGQTRDKIFTFSDGSKAHMPAMRPKGHDLPFAIGPQITRELKQLENMLHEKNNLRGLSCQDFAENAADVFMRLDHAHPFRKGNGRAQRMFMEKLGQCAGYSIDFASITKERMVQASVQAMQHGNPQPMRDLFEDATNPQKTLILKEFIGQMRHSGFEEINDRLVVAAKEGETYNGIYKGHAAEGFVIEIGEAFVVGHKDDLTPEQIKTLQNGAEISFTKTNVQSLKKILIPSENCAPLTEEECLLKVSENFFVTACKRNIEHLSKTVYGNKHILGTTMDRIHTDPNACIQLADQIIQNPQSFSHLAGRKILGIKSQNRRQAEKQAPQLGEALKNYATTVQQTKEEILEHHQREQNRLQRSVEVPSKNLQNLFSLPAEQQREALSHSKTLQKELHVLSRQLRSRLSRDDRSAIEENNHTRLSCLLGVSESKAREISQTVKCTQEAQCHLRSLKVSRSSSMALTGTLTS
ncbi:BID domain-containing T4SS effector [Bartonella rattaustraliani]|uniref:BID domain-containing T4SS effector n=1 Tax=Bartonella rattaustraliani TaxID=481139 RepID=UPI0002FD3B9E|nr:BID domain-containing T4SS effector [Bartonella rattaustraliani]